MKKTMIFIFIILTLLTGCNKNNTNENITTSNTFDIFEISNDLCQGSEIFGENMNIAEGPEGTYIHYYTNDAIYYMPDGSNEMIPLCGKPDCVHVGKFNNALETCNSYVGKDMLLGTLKYYNNKLYYISYDTDTYNAVLWQLEPDGSERSKLCTIDTFDNVPSNMGGSYNYVFKDNYIYILSNSPEKQTSELYSINIETGEKEILLTGEYFEYYHLKLYDNNLFYSQVQELNEKKAYNIYRYNISEKKEYILCTIKDKLISGYNINVIKKELYYWVVEEGLYRCSFDTGKIELIKNCTSNNDSRYIACNNKYIFLDNYYTRHYQPANDEETSFKRCIEVLDFEFNTVATISFEGHYKNLSCVYCWNKYLFIGYSEICSLDLNNLSGDIIVGEEHILKVPKLDK